MNSDLIAPCGMNCAICSAYLARKHDLKKQGVWRGYCAGCRPQGKNCALLKKRCERLSNGSAQFCFECAEYPCTSLKRLDKRYRENYHMSMLENLSFIKEQGIDAFLLEEKERWRCSKCGGTITCHGGLCYQCDLEDLKSRKKGRYKWQV